MSSLVPYFLLHRRLLLNLDFLQSSYKFFWDFYDNVNKNTTKVCLIFVKTTNTCLDFFAIGNWLFSNWSWCWRWIVSYEHHRLIECYRKSSQILMRLEELTHFIAIGSSHTHFNAIGSAHKFTWRKFSAWLTRCDWKSSQILMRLEELTNVDAIGSAHKFTWWKSCAVLGPRPAGWTASIPRSSRRWPAWSWGPCCRSSGPQTDRSHLGQHRWTQFIINK